MKTKLIAVLIFGSFVLAGCGGGGGGGDTTTSMPDPAGSPLSFAGLVNGQIVQPGTYHLVGASDAFIEALGDVEVPANGYAPDSMITIGGVSLRCTADSSSNCNIAVHEDGSFTTMGTIATVLLGGEFPMTAAERLIAEERARADAEKARADAAEAARQQEEAAKEQAEQEAAEAAARASQGDARRAIVGLRGTTAIGTVTVTPRHGALAGVTATPTGGSAINFASKSLSSSSGWSVTTQSNAGFTHNDDLVVYSNRGPATRVLLSQEYPTRFGDGSDAIADADSRLIKSGVFPTTDGDNKPFKVNYDSDPENDAADDGDASTTTDGDGITTNDYDRYRVSGTFHEAPGHFICTPAAGTDCTIGRRGDRYVIVSGTWTFEASDQARALVDDKSYVHFGWWKREQKSDEAQTFQTFRGGMSADHVATTGGGSAFDALGSTAIYRGPAIGHYAIYQPLGTQSDSGSFTASAELTANFDSNMLSGTVSDFSNDPDWSLTLNSASMAGGDVDADSGTTDWTIAGNTSRRQGAWDATFYSESPYVGQTPDVVVGDFTGIFDADNDARNGDVGRIVGVFGARK